eukprot:TCONS_00054232-protein
MMVCLSFTVLEKFKDSKWKHPRPLKARKTFCLKFRCENRYVTVERYLCELRRQIDEYKDYVQEAEKEIETLKQIGKHSADGSKLTYICESSSLHDMAIVVYILQNVSIICIFFIQYINDLLLWKRKIRFYR